MMAGSSSSSSSSTSSNSSPCAACKFLRRKCLAGCIFAAYFPAEDPQKFANVHKIFGASNVSKLLLNDVLPHQREDAVNSLAYEAEARIKDPVYGCVAAISLLQRQVLQLQKELDNTNAHLIRYAHNNVNHRQFATRTSNNSNAQFGIGDHANDFGGHTHNSAGGGFYIGSSPWSGHDHDHGDQHSGGGN